MTRREPERNPGHGVAQHGVGLAAIADQHSAADEDEEGHAERDIAERVAVEIGDGARGVAHEQHGGERQDEKGNPCRQISSLSTVSLGAFRAGNIAMMARRSSALIAAQRAISSMVRPQPRHRPEALVDLADIDAGGFQGRLRLAAVNRSYVGGELAPDNRPFGVGLARGAGPPARSTRPGGSSAISPARRGVAGPPSRACAGR